MSWAKSLQPRYQVVAEVKTISPFGYVNPRVARLQEGNPYGWRAPGSLYEDMVREVEWADIISIHTNPLWGGSWEWLEQARKLTTKPILAKGFHPTIHDVRRALDLGADWVLTVGWCPPHPEGAKCWVESRFAPWDMVPNMGRLVINRRDPRTGVDLGEASTREQIDHCRAVGSWTCQASMIRRPEDVHPGVQAVLIGEGL